MKRILSVAPARHLWAIIGLAIVVTADSLSAADHYYVNDHLATTTAVTDAAGEIAAIEADAFGTPVAGATQAARYTGKPYDHDIGAFVFPFRNYRSDEARWMSADPSGFPDGVNACNYSPRVNRDVDPTGLLSVVGNLSPSPSSVKSNGYTVTAATAFWVPSAVNLNFSGYVFAAGNYAGTLNVGSYSAFKDAGGGGVNIEVAVSPAIPGDTVGNTWIQVINDGSPSGPFIDNDGGITPFYDSTNGGAADSVSFYDAPRRSNSTVSWVADLYYVRLTGKAVTVFGGIHYSWSMSE